SLDPKLILFSTEFEIRNTMEKVSTAMYGILKSIGINFSSHEYIQIIQDCFNSISNIHFDNDDKEIEIDLNYDNAKLVIEEHYSFFDIINHWICSKPLDPIKVMKEMALYREAALRIERMNATEKSTF
ncbi:14993_t:CDS:2, partial [Funneliformis caledonium]